MAESFKPHSLTINKLLTDSDSLYQIPLYQRAYKWGDEEVDQLWSDIVESYQNEEPDYFLGSIITVKPEQNGDKYLDVVDGQQRLTTLIILMATIRDLYPNINKEECEKDPYAIGLDQIKNVIMVNGKFSRLRLASYSNQSSDFEKYIIKGNTGNLEKPKKIDLKIDEAPQYKFINTSFEFRWRLEDLGENESGKLLNYIFNQINIIRIDCSNVDFAIKLFEVLNARGLNLTNADRIKSYLIGRLHSTYAEEKDVRAKQQKLFMQDWATCEELALDMDKNINDLFTSYQFFLLASSPRKSLYAELENLFKDENPMDVIADFKVFITEYKTNIHKIYTSKDPIDYSFRYLKWSNYWQRILATALHTEYPNIEEVKNMVRRYFYLFWIAGLKTSDIKPISFKLIEWLKEKIPINEIKQKLEKHIKKYNLQEKVEIALGGDVYNNPCCKPLLALIEMNHWKTPKFIDIKKNKQLQVEHVLPRSYAKVAGWAHMKEDERVDSNLVHSLGNLTFLSDTENRAAANHAFEDKVELYQGKTNESKGRNKVVSFKITQMIYETFQANLFKQWDFSVIDTRKKYLLEQIEELFQINLEKIK